MNNSASPGGYSAGGGDSDFRFVVDAKADRSELEELRLQKSNKTDIEHILDWIKLLHNQIKHIIVIQTELAQSLMKVQSEAESVRIQRQAFIAKQCVYIGKWINQFDSENLIQMLGQEKVSSVFASPLEVGALSTLANTNSDKDMLKKIQGGSSNARLSLRNTKPFKLSLSPSGHSQRDNSQTVL